MRNNGEIEVKRGETVKRGQTIAKSGQTGNVATPQLHFELRKGSTPGRSDAIPRRSLKSFPSGSARQRAEGFRRGSSGPPPVY